jgi:hypothetical protein
VTSQAFPVTPDGYGCGMAHGGSSAEADAPVCGTGTHGFDPRLSPEECWLAGLLEGEGSFMLIGHTPHLCVQMADRDIVERLAATWGLAVSSIRLRHRGSVRHPARERSPDRSAPSRASRRDIGGFKSRPSPQAGAPPTVRWGRL